MGQKHSKGWKMLLHDDGDGPRATLSQEDWETIKAESMQLDCLNHAVEHAKDGDHRLLLWWLTEHAGFYPTTAKYLTHCILGKKPPRPISWMEYWRGRLDEIKSELRASGEKSKIHERAVEVLEKEYSDQIAFAVEHSALPPDTPPFDRNKFENFYRRSRQPRKRPTKSSRAK